MFHTDADKQLQNETFITKTFLTNVNTAGKQKSESDNQNKDLRLSHYSPFHTGTAALNLNIRGAEAVCENPNVQIIWPRH